MLFNPNRPSQCFTASPVRARERQIRAPKKRILGGIRRGTYPTHVTVYPYKGYIGSTNPIVRHVMSLTCTPKRMRANPHAPKHPATQPLHGSNTRARPPNLVPSYDLTVGAPTRMMLPFIRATDKLQLQIFLLPRSNIRCLKRWCKKLCLIKRAAQLLLHNRAEHSCCCVATGYSLIIWTRGHYVIR